MASTIIKFPDGRTEVKNIKTAYHEVNGTDYIVFETGKMDNGNEVVGVSYKVNGEERYQKIVDIEEWKKAKGILVKDLHDQQENFEYTILKEETLVTEDYAKDLALRAENLTKLTANYEEFLKSKQVSQPEATIDPFSTNEMVSPIISEVNEEIAPAVSIAPMPEMTKVEENIVSAPIMETPIMDSPSIQEVSKVTEPMPSPILDTQIPNENISIFPTVSSVEQANNNENSNTTLSSSAVENSYIENMNALIEQMKKLTANYIKEMENLKIISIETFKQIQELKKLAETTVKNAETVMANAKNNVYEQEPVLSKVA